MYSEYTQEKKRNMETEFPELPFPVVDKKNNPVVYPIDPDEIDDDLQIFYYTIPMKALKPAPSSLNDFENTQYAYQIKTIFSVLARLCQKMFYAEDDKKILNDAGTERIKIFMEYLLPEGIDIDEDIQLIDCVGIRFYIYICDKFVDYMEGLKKLIAENHDEYEKAKKKHKIVPENPAFEAYKNIEDMYRWYMFCNTYTGRKLKMSELMLNTHSQTDDSPRLNHPLHPLRVFNWEHSIVPNLCDMQKVEQNHFAIPHVVYKIEHTLFNPMTMLVTTLPRSFRWTKQNDFDFANTLDALTNVKFMKRYFSDMYMKKNDLKDLNTVQKLKYKKLVNKDLPPEEKAVLIRDFRLRSVKYLENMWSPTSNVSQTIKAMSKWVLNYKTWTTTKNKVVDRDMSYFGNMIANDFISLEKDLKISTTHTVFFRVIVNCLNAYVYKYNLHNNVVLVGGGGLGKSHIFNEIQRIFIEGTTSDVGHKTQKADTVDTDENDHITFFQETPASLLTNSKDKNMDTGDDLWKNLLTACKIFSEMIFIDHETGRRKKIKCEAEKVGVHIIACNESIEKFSAPMATRFIFILVNEYVRPRFSVQQKTMNVFDKELDSNKNKNEEEYILRWRFRQVMVNMVEKMIYEFILKDVDMSICHVMYNNMIMFMKDKGIIQSSSDTIRNVKFLINFARTLTIIYAVDKYANDPDSYGFNKPISFENLMNIQSLLICNEEIALFAFSICLDQMINFDTFMVMELLLAACNEFFEKSSDDEPVVNEKGFYYTKPVFNDFFSIMKHIIKAQQNHAFDVKLSDENIKTAYNNLKMRNYKNQPIIDYDRELKSISINSSYVEDNFEYDDNLGRFVAKIDAQNIVKYVFQESYAHAHLRTRKVILGTTYDLNFPFVFDTFVMKPKERKFMQLHDQDYDFLKKASVEKRVIDNDIESINSFIFVKKDFESYVLTNYLRSIGMTEASELFGSEPQKILYDYHKDTFHSEDCLKLPYPENVVKMFSYGHGIELKKRKKLDTSDIFKQLKKHKMLNL